MTEHTYHRWPDDDSGKWLVLDENKHFAAGPFEKPEQADAWINQQSEIQQRMDS